MRMMKQALFMIAMIGGVFFCATAMEASAADCEVNITTTRPEVGKPLNTETLGTADGCSYKWYVEQKYVGGGETYAPTINDYEKWIRVEIVNNATQNVVAEDSLFFSNLPVVYIDTEDQAPVVDKETYIASELYIQGTNEFDMQYQGAAEIKGRGNTSWNYPKKPYKLKLDSKADLFGMGKNKHYVLLANYNDDSLMRNTLATMLANQLGVEAMATVWVDVVMNGAYIGNYQLCEQVRVGTNRVDVFDWEGCGEDIAKAIAKKQGFSSEDKEALVNYMTTNFSWIDKKSVTYNGVNYSVLDYIDDIPSIDGGYLFESSLEYDEVSKFTTTSGYKIMVKAPEFLITSAKAIDFSKKLWNRFDEAIGSIDGYTKDGEWIGDFVDLDSMVRYWLVNELMGNIDSAQKSRYAYIEQGGKLTFGPVWDFDWSSASKKVDQEATGWKPTASNSTQNFFAQWVDDPVFIKRAYEIYHENRSFFGELLMEKGFFEQSYKMLVESGKKNDEVWSNDRGFEADYKILKEYLAKRLAWMDEQFASYDEAVWSLRSIKTSKNKYNKNSAPCHISVGNGVAMNDVANANVDYLYFNCDQVTFKLVPEENMTIKLYVDGKFAEKYYTTETIYAKLNRALLENKSSALVTFVGTTDAGVRWTGYRMVRLEDVDLATCDHKYIRTKKQDAAYKVDGYVREVCVCCKKILSEKIYPMLLTPFSDVPGGSWYENSVAFLKDKKIINGTTATTFSPTMNLTRGQLVVMLWNLEGCPVVTNENVFSDVSSSAYYYKAVLWAVKNNIVHGSNGRFFPGDNILRQDLAVILKNYSVYKKIPNKAVAISSRYDKEIAKTASYAIPSVIWAIGNNIMGSNYVVNARSFASRAEVASMLARYLINVQGVR